MKIFFLALAWWGIAFCRAEAQNETNVWYFGNNAGLDFSSGSPVAISNTTMNTLEGSASISHRSTGQLRFYTDGITVWNKNHLVMLNGFGLNGHSSSTQSAVIVPLPGDTMKYYIFTADQGGYAGLNKGIHYSIIDMTLDGGLGAVTTKNVFLLKPATEKLAAVMHCDGVSIWVIVHEWNSNKFHAWKVETSGITDTVITAVGAVHQDSGVPYDATIGYLKASTDGKRLALATYSMNLVQVFDFDNSTGIVSSPVTLTAAGYDYGLSFSPDNSKLYVANTSPAQNKGLYQFNLLAGDAVAINASRRQIFSLNLQNYFGALQIASDGKIYVVKPRENTLGVINDPNALGTFCNYNNTGISIAPRKGTGGLPNFIESFFVEPLAASFTYDSACAVDTICFYGSSLPVGERWFWHFGDPASGVNDTSTAQQGRHSFSGPGTYVVTLIVEKKCQRDSISQTITILPRLRTCIESQAINNSVAPGETMRLSLVLKNTQYVRTASSSSVALTYDPELLRFIAVTPTGSTTMPGFVSDEKAGTLSLTVIFSDSLSSPNADIATVKFQALLAERRTGSLEITDASIVHQGKTITSDRCTIPFTIKETCIPTSDLHKRGGARISGIYPNPASDYATIAFELHSSARVMVDVIDVFGRSVSHAGASLVTGAREITLSIGALSRGLYFVRLQSDGVPDFRSFTIIN